MASIRSPGPMKNSVILRGCDSGMPVGCHDVKRHALDAEFVELRCPDVRDTPELHFAGAHGDGGIDLTVDRNDFALVRRA